jgi:hypothetical protein
MAACAIAMAHDFHIAKHSLRHDRSGIGDLLRSAR